MPYVHNARSRNLALWQCQRTSTRCRGRPRGAQLRSEPAAMFSSAFDPTPPALHICADGHGMQVHPSRERTNVPAADRTAAESGTARWGTPATSRTRTDRRTDPLRERAQSRPPLRRRFSRFVLRLRTGHAPVLLADSSGPDRRARPAACAAFERARNGAHHSQIASERQNPATTWTDEFFEPCSGISTASVQSVRLPAVRNGTIRPPHSSP
ncbi:hypothetical protein B0H21DRAFT_136366 [Amylocystis lapponica]|nr:hypothetical protein B0H21DRAFT_136366 [Amylocystis lapponica]